MTGERILRPSCEAAQSLLDLQRLLCWEARHSCRASFTRDRSVPPPSSGVSTWMRDPPQPGTTHHARAAERRGATAMGALSDDSPEEPSACIGSVGTKSPWRGLTLGLAGVADLSPRVHIAGTGASACGSSWTGLAARFGTGYSRCGSRRRFRCALPRTPNRGEGQPCAYRQPLPEGMLAEQLGPLLGTPTVPKVLPAALLASLVRS